MSTTPLDKIKALSEKIATAETTAAVGVQAATEADRAKLDDLRAQHARESAAEDARQDARRKAWAEDYLANHHDTERTAQAKAEREARRALADALADQPWVQALIGWQRAQNERATIAERANIARQSLGHPAGHDPAATPLLPLRDGVVHLDPLARVLYDLLGDDERTTGAEEVALLVAAPDGKDDPLADALAYVATAPGGPLDRLHREGGTVEQVRYETTNADGTTTQTVMHRNVGTGSWVHTTATGTPIRSSFDAPTTKRATDNPIDGAQFGSVLDSERRKFIKTRVN